MMIRLQTKLQLENGTGLIENMVSLSILAIVIASVTSSIFLTMHGNAASRSYTAMISEIQSMVDAMRQDEYTNLLDKFGSLYTSIDNNESVTENISGIESNANYAITYTAIKRTANTLPEAIRIRFVATHTQGSLGLSNSTFETIIAGGS
jgi:type II secretory pathway pseudopilin PulG